MNIQVYADIYIYKYEYIYIYKYEYKYIYKYEYIYIYKYICIYKDISNDPGIRKKPLQSEAPITDLILEKTGVI